MTAKQLGRRLHALREARGPSRQSLAAKAGLSREAVRLLEHGRFEVTVQTLQRVARALGTTAYAILKGL